MHKDPEVAGVQRAKDRRVIRAGGDNVGKRDQS